MRYQLRLRHYNKSRHNGFLTKPQELLFTMDVSESPLGIKSLNPRRLKSFACGPRVDPQGVIPRPLAPSRMHTAIFVDPACTGTWDSPVRSPSSTMSATSMFTKTPSSPIPLHVIPA